MYLWYLEKIRRKSAIPDTQKSVGNEFVSARLGPVGQMCRLLAVGPTCRRHVGNFPSQAVWTLTSTRLCCLSLHRPGVVSLCQLVVASPLDVPSLRLPLVILLLSRQLVVALSLVALSLRCPLVVLSRQLVVALPLTVLSLCHPLVNSSHQLVFASPLLVLSLRSVPPSHPLVALAGCCVASQRATLSSPCVLSCRLSLSCRASWLSHHHLLHRPLDGQCGRVVRPTLKIAEAGVRVPAKRRC
jgi:hypothetical protein